MNTRLFRILIFITILLSLGLNVSARRTNNRYDDTVYISTDLPEREVGYETQIYDCDYGNIVTTPFGKKQIRYYYSIEWPIFLYYGDEKILEEAKTKIILRMLNHADEVLTEVEGINLGTQNNPRKWAGIRTDGLKSFKENTFTGPLKNDLKIRIIPQGNEKIILDYTEYTIENNGEESKFHNQDIINLPDPFSKFNN